MNRRVNTIACALLVSALVVPASEARSQRAPVKHHQLVAHARTSAFAGLGHEGSALRKVEVTTQRLREPRRRRQRARGPVGCRHDPAVGVAMPRS